MDWLARALTRFSARPRLAAVVLGALAATGFSGNLESVFGRAQVVGGGAMLVGSVAGGFIAQATDLGVPYIVRAAMLGVTLVIAWWFMHDLGFTPQRGVTPVTAVRTVLTGAVDPEILELLGG